MAGGGTRGGQYNKPGIVKWRASEAAQRRKRINQFADLLSKGYTISAASRAIGVSQQNGSTMLAQIRDELGPQAI